MTLKFRMIGSSPSGDCAIRITGSLEGMNEFIVPPEIFDDSTACETSTIAYDDVASSTVVIKVKGKLFGKFDVENVSLKLFDASNEDEPYGVWQSLLVTKKSYGFAFDLKNVYSQHGLPEHTVDFDLPTKFDAPEDDWYRFYNADVFEYELKSPMAMYASIPWLVSHQKHQVVSGILLVQPSELYIKLVKHGEDVQGASDRTALMVGEHSRFDISIYHENSANGFTGITKQMTQHTGRAPLPPTASLGLHQARWNYFSQSDVDYVSTNYIKHQLPLDYIWLDIDHSDGRRYFTWNKRTFPKPFEMLRKLRDRKQNLVVIVDPHIKATDGYALYDQMIKGTTADGQSLLVLESSSEGQDRSVFHGWCWPGRSVYPDTVQRSAELTQIYKPWFESWPSLYSLKDMAAKGARCPDTWNASGALCDLLVRRTTNVGVWIDMNEPSVFNGPQVTMAKDLRHGTTGPLHSQVHNAYGLYYAKVIFNALLEAGGRASQSSAVQRPFVLTRSGFVGSQKYGAIWTGDNTASYAHLENSISMVLSMALSGFSFVGADVGGFFGEPDSQLFYKWLQVGVWYPFFRVHSTLGSTRRELFAYSGHQVQVGGGKSKEFVHAVRELLDLRYSLIPFWIKLVHEHSVEGRPLWTSVLDFELREFAAGSEESIAGSAAAKGFVVGDAFFVDPGLPGDKALSLPRGAEWLTWPNLQTPSQNKAAGHGGGVFVRTGQLIFTKEKPRLNVESQRFDPYTITAILDEQKSETCGSFLLEDMRTTAPVTVYGVCARANAMKDTWVIEPISSSPGQAGAGAEIWGTKLGTLRVGGSAVCAGSGDVEVRVFGPSAVSQETTRKCSEGEPLTMALSVNLADSWKVEVRKV